MWSNTNWGIILEQKIKTFKTQSDKCDVYFCCMSQNIRLILFDQCINTCLMSQRFVREYCGNKIETPFYHIWTSAGFFMMLSFQFALYKHSFMLFSQKATCSLLHYIAESICCLHTHTNELSGDPFLISGVWFVDPFSVVVTSALLVMASHMFIGIFGY